MRIRPVGAEFFHAETDGRTDTTKLTAAFRNFANAPKKWRYFIRRKTECHITCNHLGPHCAVRSACRITATLTRME